jgi:hypothetical protein
MKYAEENKDRRRSPRIEECSDYLFSPATGRADSFVLKNISATGACIETDMTLAVDQILDLHICRNRDLELKSQVVWIKGREYGLSFMLDTEESFSAISFIMNTKR